MPGIRRSRDHSIYQLKVMLRGSKPPIWRRIRIRAGADLADLHEVLQVVFDWHNYHLHQFVVGQTYYGTVDEDWGDGTEDESGVKLSKVAPREKSRFDYEYDFGDSWVHQIEVEKVVPPDPGAMYPVCVTGRRTAPPEDCGGIWGYYEMLQAVEDADHPEHEDMLEWLGGGEGVEWDPDAFDLAGINKRLEKLRA